MAWVHLKSEAAVTINVVTEYRWSFPYGLLLSIKVHDTGETSMAIELGEDAQRDVAQLDPGEQQE